MKSDVRAGIEAALAQYERQRLPSLAELQPVTEALAELRGKITAAIREHGTALGLAGDLVVQEIHQACENAASALLDSRRQRKLALFLDTDGTDKGLERISGTVDATDIKDGLLASTDGKIGTIKGCRSELDVFARRFLVDSGYSDFETASINQDAVPMTLRERRKRRPRNPKVIPLVAEGVRMVDRGESMNKAAAIIANREWPKDKKLATSETALVDQIRRGIREELKWPG